MYFPTPEEEQASGAWTPMIRQSSRNRYQPAVRVIRWRELRGLSHLADGAMCSCYTARLEGHGVVVVKKPSHHSNETREEIERELDIEKAYLANLRHPNIVRLIGSGQRGIKSHFEPFLVLEYLAGGTLGHLITERRRGGGEPVEKGVNRKRGAFELPHFVLDGKKNYIPWAQAMGWARDMASALEYMHHEASKSHMYICRDLKPDNIGFAADGTLKIFDFGLAKRLPRKVGTNQRYTMTSRTGTVRYMAPEAFLGCSYNEKVDVYAWSHVVAEMLSLDVPYHHMTTQQFRETVALGSRRPHIERRWPRSIQRLLRRCWDREPNARPSFAEILGAGTLEQAAGPSHPWLHHFGIHRQTAPSTPEWKAAAAKAAKGHPVTPTPASPSAPRVTATRERSATVDDSGHHRSERGRGRRAGERGGRGDGEGGGAEADDDAEVGAGRSRSISTPARFRLGPLHLPVCFFGGKGGGTTPRHGTSNGDGEDKRSAKDGDGIDGVCHEHVGVNGGDWGGETGDDADRAAGEGVPTGRRRVVDSRVGGAKAAGGTTQTNGKPNGHVANGSMEPETPKQERRAWIW